MINRGNRLESSREPLSRRRHWGSLMMVSAGSAAESAGLHSGDLVQRVNGAPVSSDLDLLRKIDESYFMVLIEGLRGGSGLSVVLNKRRPGRQDAADPFAQVGLPAATAAPLWHRGAALGLIPAPSSQTPIYARERRAAGHSLLRRLRGHSRGS